ncbi:MAG: serine/threonine protein kinase, partial [Verrucomicrobiae bacterium]|nr:serine/threonine protein kinase [Verrucomicrobiae bacterium]
MSMDGRTEIDLSSYNPQSDEPFALNDRYRLDSIVGQGGMGKVFLGTDLVLNRPVVVKVLLAEYVQEKTFVERFTREAKILSQINHPHLLVIYDYGIYALKTPYIVTEYVEGKTLAEIIREDGRMQVKRAINLICQVADALAAAHTHGVIHRDLKAENVLIGGPANSEWVKVIDFGLAYQKDHRKISEHAARLTGSGLFVGTLAYMPPEQFMNENLDARTDVYSMGILLWEMLVGHVPFMAPSLEGFYAKHSSEPVPRFASITPPLPTNAVSVEPVIDKALAKRAKERWKDATEFKLNLVKAHERSLQNIPYEAFNIKTERIPTDRVPYPDTGRLREYEKKVAARKGVTVRRAKGKTTFNIIERSDTKKMPLTWRAKALRAVRQAGNTVRVLFLTALYLVILAIVSAAVYFAYPKVKGIIYPPPHVSLEISGINVDSQFVSAELGGTADNCEKLGKVKVEATLVDATHKLLPAKSDSGFLKKNEEGTFVDSLEVPIHSRDEPVQHTIYLPLAPFLDSAGQKFCIRIRVLDEKNEPMGIYFSSAQT